MISAAGVLGVSIIATKIYLSPASQFVSLKNNLYSLFYINNNILSKLA